MTSSRSSKLTALVLLSALVIAAAAPVAGVSVTNEDAPEAAAVGDTVEASFTIENLYQNPQVTRWTLRGATEMRNVTWIVSLEDAGGTTVYTDQFTGQTFQLAGISQESRYGTVITVKLTVRGEVPPVTRFTYPAREQFLLAELTQQAGQTGSTNTIGSWSPHHYTTGDDDEPGSRQARQAIDAARSAVRNASNESVAVPEANQTLRAAVSSYRNGNFGNAIDLATTAEQRAEQAVEQKRQSRQQSQLLLYVGVAVVLLALGGGGFWWYRQQQDQYDKLG